ncbi:MAG: RNA methyltransferase [Gemmatimonadota bacterium]
MLTRKQRSLLHTLHRRRVREREGLFLAEGPRVVRDLVASSLECLFVVSSSSFADSEGGVALSEALEGRAPLVRVEDEAFADVSRTETPQGILAVARIPAVALDGLALATGDVALALDGVQDPGNVGTLARTAEALGASVLIVLEGTADPWGPKVVRAAAGALFRLPTPRAPSADCVAWCRRENARILVADRSGGPIRSLRRDALRPTLLVLGNEAAGGGPTMAAAADAKVAVPQCSVADSLNVAAAGAILLWELLAGEEPE